MNITVQEILVDPTTIAKDLMARLNPLKCWGTNRQIKATLPNQHAYVPIVIFHENNETTAQIYSTEKIQWKGGKIILLNHDQNCDLTTHNIDIFTIEGSQPTWKFQKQSVSFCIYITLINLVFIIRDNAFANDIELLCTWC